MSREQHTTRPQALDTPLEIEAMQLERYRRMSPAQKLSLVADLSLASRQLAEARIRAQQGQDVSRREIRLRLASLYLDRSTMIDAFGWDPEVEGY
jgi:hypothetical protein